jgi:Holliday junction resolvase-like predicted endonuclease
MQRVSVLNRATARRAQSLGKFGEKVAPGYLERKGFNEIRDLNQEEKMNYPFADLIACRNGRKFLISVKTRNKYEARTGNLNARYKLHKEGFRAKVEALAEEHGAIPAWVAIQLDGEQLSAYFGTLGQLSGNRGIPMTEDAIRHYECLAHNEKHGIDVSGLKNAYTLRPPVLPSA